MYKRIQPADRAKSRHLTFVTFYNFHMLKTGIFGVTTHARFQPFSTFYNTFDRLVDRLLYTSSCSILRLLAWRLSLTYKIGL